jgi:hypothetical protein
MFLRNVGSPNSHSASHPRGRYSSRAVLSLVPSRRPETTTNMPCSDLAFEKRGKCRIMSPLQGTHAPLSTAPGMAVPIRQSGQGTLNARKLHELRNPKMRAKITFDRFSASYNGFQLGECPITEGTITPNTRCK